MDDPGVRNFIPDLVFVGIIRSKAAFLIL